MKPSTSLNSACTIYDTDGLISINFRQNLERALAIHEKINGLDYSHCDQLTIVYTYALAALTVDVGRPSDALKYANKAVSMLSLYNKNAPGYVELVSSHLNLELIHDHWVLQYLQLPAEYAYTKISWINISKTWAP